MMVTGDVTMVTGLQGRSGASSTDSVIVTVAPQLSIVPGPSAAALACMKAEPCQRWSK